MVTFQWHVFCRSYQIRNPCCSNPHVLIPLVSPCWTPKILISPAPVCPKLGSLSHSQQAEIFTYIKIRTVNGCPGDRATNHRGINPWGWRLRPQILGRGVVDES